MHIQQISLPPFSFLPKKGYFMKKYSLYVSECSEFSKYNLSIPNIFSLQRVLWVYGVKIPMEQGLKSGKSNNGTGYPEKTPAAHTCHFRGHVPPPRVYTLFFYRNHVYRNVQAEIWVKIKSNGFTFMNYE